MAPPEVEEAEEEAVAAAVSEEAPVDEELGGAVAGWLGGAGGAGGAWSARYSYNFASIT